MAWLFKKQKDEAQVIIDDAMKEDKKREKEEEKQRKIKEAEEQKLRRIQEKQEKRIQGIQRIQSMQGIQKPQIIDFSKGDIKLGKGRNITPTPLKQGKNKAKKGKKGRNTSNYPKIEQNSIDEPERTSPMILLSLNEIQELKRCPKCNSKLQKSKVFQKKDVFENYLNQIIKCRNVMCDFIQEVKIKVQ